MVKIVILVIISIFTLYRWLVLKKSRADANFLLISLFVQTIPFAYGKALYTYFPKRSEDSLEINKLGEFGNSIRIEMALIFLAVLVFLGLFKFKPKNINISREPWFFIFLFFCALSLLNPINPVNTAFIPILSFIIQILILLKFLDANFKKDEVLKGIFDGLLIISLLQLVLSICFPILGIEAAATLFKGENALDWTDRREGYLSAVGIFGHPGILALYCLLCAIFFLACFLNKFRRKLSIYLVACNLFVIALTFSRSAYIATLAVLLLLIVIQKQNKSIFSLKNIFILSSSFLFLLLILYLSPLSDMFLKSDANNQINNRLAHWYLGSEVWKNSIWVGTGINSHVYYMSHKLVITVDLPILTFLISNPIHNIHMIVLAETGLAGIGLWLYFFYSRLKHYSKYCKTPRIDLNIFNLTYIGFLTALFVYGFFGWAPFRFEILGICIFVGFFANTRNVLASARKSDNSTKTAMSKTT